MRKTLLKIYYSAFGTTYKVTVDWVQSWGLQTDVGYLPATKEYINGANRSRGYVQWG